jgi:hypothetical protein
VSDPRSENPTPGPATPADATANHPLAVDAAGAARLFSVGLRTWRRWDSAGKCPGGHKVGGRRLWRLCDLQRWSAWGFPDRLGFQARQEAEEGAAA